MEVGWEVGLGCFQVRQGTRLGVAFWWWRNDLVKPEKRHQQVGRYYQREDMNAPGGVGVTLARSFLARWCGLLAGEAGGCPGAEEVTKSHACTLLHCTAG